MAILVTTGTGTGPWSEWSSTTSVITGTAGNGFSGLWISYGACPKPGIKGMRVESIILDDVLVKQEEEDMQTVWEVIIRVGNDIVLEEKVAAPKDDNGALAIARAVEQGLKNSGDTSSLAEKIWEEDVEICMRPFQRK